MARIRSPNYPQISLPEAINLVKQIHQQEAQNFAPRDVIAKLLGYGGVNGASEKKTGALNAYGLLEKALNRELRVSDLAMVILFPHNDEEKKSALAKSLLNPPLFQDIKEKWPDNEPSDENLRSYLIRRGFNQNSIDQVIDCYRASLALVSVESSVVESPSDELSADKGKDMPLGEIGETGGKIPPVDKNPPLVGKPIIFDMETVSGQYQFDNAEDLAEFIEKLEKIKTLMPTRH